MIIFDPFLISHLFLCFSSTLLCYHEIPNYSCRLPLGINALLIPPSLGHQVTNARARKIRPKSLTYSSVIGFFSLDTYSCLGDRVKTCYCSRRVCTKNRAWCWNGLKIGTFLNVVSNEGKLCC